MVVLFKHYFFCFLVWLWCSGLSLSQPATCDAVQCSDCGAQIDCCMFVEEEQQDGTFVGNANVNDDIRRALNTNTQAISLVGTSSDFELNTTTGEIITKRVINRENEAKQCISLTVSVQTDGDTIPVLIGIKIVDINDNVPMFQVNSWTTNSAETTTNYPQMQICNFPEANDADEGSNSDLSYTIGGPDGAMFTLNAGNCIVNTVPIDRDSVPDPRSVPTLVLNLHLMVADNGSPSQNSSLNVTINVSDLNDNTPVLKNSTLTVNPIREDTVPGRKVHVFEAEDPDYSTEFHYMLQDTTGPFNVLDTGELVLLASPELDFESLSEYTVSVAVTDMAADSSQVVMTSSTKVVVVPIENVNEEAQITPALSFCNNVEENSTDCDITYTIVDVDSSKKNDYQVKLSGPWKQYFSSDLHEGFNSIIRASIELVHPIDQENLIAISGNDSFVINISIIELGSPEISHNFSNTITVIGINDNLPTLKKFSFVFPEENGTGARITELEGEDLDAGKNGTVTSYTLVSAIAYPDTVLTQDFKNANNDGPLVITGKRDLSVDERIPTFATLLSPNIDRDQTPGVDRINITLMLTDGGGLSNTVYITVNISDLNDHVPTFPSKNVEFKFRENEPIGIKVGRVAATDLDTGSNAEIRYSLQAPPREFSVDEMTGEIKTLKKFDREEKAEYSIVVMAKNLGVNNSSQTNVRIVVTDINDVPPRWNEDITTEFIVQSDYSVGQIVGFVMAIDNDDSEIENNVLINYRFLTQNNSLFSINAGTAAISVNSDLTDKVGEYNLTIEAFNPGGPASHVAILNITIIVVVSNVATSSTLILSVSVASASFVAFVVALVLVLLIICISCCNKRQSHNFPKMNGGPYNNVDGRNSPKRGILRQVPTITLPNRAGSVGANGTSRGVTFVDKVQEISYIGHDAVTNDAIYYTEASINLGSSGDESPQTPPRLHPSIHHNGKLPLDSHPHVPNGGSSLSPIEEDYYCHAHTHPPQRSSLMSDGPYYLHHSEHLPDYDGNSDDDSTFPDDTSNINAPMPSISPHIMRYISSPQHAMPHLPPAQSSSPAHVILGDMSPSHQYSHQHSPHHSNSLTLIPHDHSPRSAQSASLDSLTATPLDQHLAHENPRLMHQSSRGSSYPSHMPEAYVAPTPTSVVRPRYEDTFMENFDGSDYGDALTYASEDLDEALHFRPDLEPGIFSLTATSSVYSDGNEESQL